MRTAKEFWSRAEDQSNGCINWAGAIGGAGYGNVWFLGSLVNTHRIAYRLAKGRIPKGQYVFHSCDNRACVNPEHLFLGDQLSNPKKRISRITRKHGDGLSKRALTKRIRSAGRKNGLRSVVLKRDKGICVDCGLDCAALDARLKKMAETNRDELRAACTELSRLGFTGVSRWSGTRPFTSTWSADHHDPLFEGGADDISNVVTRCRACHGEKTSAEASRRARQRRLIGVKFIEQRRRDIVSKRFK